MALHTQMRVRLLALTLLAWLGLAKAFYLPGYSIKSYRNDEAIPVFVNKIFSDNTQLQYAYFDLPFVCPPTGKKHDSPFASGHSISLNLGEVLRGDRIMASDFDVVMGKDVECRFLCSRPIDRNDIKRAKELITDGYVAEWIMDNLPGATSFVTVDRTRKYYATGFKLGYLDVSPVDGKPRHYIHNHFTFVIRWREAPGKAGRQGGKVIVGFEIHTKSIDTNDRLENGCPRKLQADHDGLALHIPSNNTSLAQQYADSSYIPEHVVDVDDGATLSIPYTYSVYFRKEDKVEWWNRWDLYFNNQREGTTTHWLAILNSLVVSGVLGVTVFVIWGKTAQGDVKCRGDGAMEEGKIRPRPRKSKSGSRTPKSGENISNGLSDKDLEADEPDTDDELEEVAGWKLLHGDVFRTPEYSGLLAPLVGSGMQLLFMAAGLLLLSCLGVLNPSFRGGFLSVGIGLFVFAGVFSGYFSGRLYRTFRGQNWRKNTMITALLFPGLLFCLVFVLNLFVWAQASSTALPFGTLVGLLALWLLIQVPLVYLGSWFGFMWAKPWEHPTRTNAIARQIPPQSWYLRTVHGTLLTGLVPFTVLFVELLFVFKNLLQDKSGHYYVFGYLSVVCTILIVTVAQVTIIATYCQLSSENHRWWWQSFFTGGSGAFWIFMYCIWYYFAKLHVRGFVSSLLFFSYSFLGCAVYGLLAGTVGFLTAYAFVRRIYSSVKVD
ncbi:multispanning membrane protein [Blastomyces gilchristii SLH14081]|uniref:Transmembrane 9 superfamily member n=1 Tax=Blastomyces gilchristii (strain SLH14081) TaxID=559298 RepID=A0A179UNQ9_BLAGS|nr:multispanning membrane protein [Blastomyces gilchristii SLH14081]OAT09470.1 multispanning membrane protein [Blastomyces gilchristii SLH14081]